MSPRRIGPRSARTSPRKQRWAKLADRRAALTKAARALSLVEDRLDHDRRPRLPAGISSRDVIWRARDAFVGMGTGSPKVEAELDWYNFEALNFPPGHPARDARHALRSQEPEQ